MDSPRKPDPIHFNFRVGKKRIRLCIDEEPEACPPEELRQIEQAILDAVTDVPTPAKVVARLAKRAYGSHFRQALADLIRKGKVRRTPEGISSP